MTIKICHEFQRLQGDDFRDTTQGPLRVLRVFLCVLCEPLIVQSRVHKEHKGRHEENFHHVSDKSPVVQNSNSCNSWQMFVSDVL